VDDLLSQLAGDEIDRLLAEADEEAPAPLKSATAIDAPVEPIQFDDEPPPPAAAPPASTPRLSPNSPLAKLNALADVPPEPASAAGEASALGDDAMTVDAETRASLDALSSELDPAAAAQSGVLPPGAVEKVLADEAAGLLGTPRVPAPQAVPADEFGTSADERGALSAGVDAEIAAAAKATKPLGAAVPEADASGGEITSNDLNAVLGPGEDDAPLPLLLRPLEWINVPLEACPPSVRDVMGRAAIITMVNAVAVLVYVAFFRR
jgi:hypothetical protein